MQDSKTRFRIPHIKRVNQASDVRNYLLFLERQNRWSKKYVILDCSAELTKEALILHLENRYLGRRNFHYLLTRLVSKSFHILYTIMAKFQKICPVCKQARLLFNYVKDYNYSLQSYWHTYVIGVTIQIKATPFLWCIFSYTRLFISWIPIFLKKLNLNK